jgi:flagellar hook assembly protein FlgD
MQPLSPIRINARDGIDPWNGLGASRTRMEGTATRQSSAAAETAPPSSGFTEAAETPASSLANKQTFLTLLVAQIKNQNPLNPADGTEFLSQLAQFSELEQLISIREEMEALNKAGGLSPKPSTNS